jgi:hypothetical protein
MEKSTTLQENIGTEEVRMIFILSPFERGNLYEAKEEAKDREGELPSIKEFILWLNKSPKNLESARGDIYWVRDAPGVELFGPCKIDYEKGTIDSVSREIWNKNLTQKNSAWAYPGGGNILLRITNNDSKTGRLELIASYGSKNTRARIAYVLKQKPESNNVTQTLRTT